MKVVVSLETNATQKLIIGTFNDPYYASLLTEAVLRANHENKVYTKLTVELAEADDEQR